MKVCIIAPSPTRLGGHAVQASLLRAALHSHHGIESRLVATDADLPRWLGWLANTRGVRTAARLAVTMPQLVASALRSDALHVFTPANWAFLLSAAPAFLVGRVLGRPVILNYHAGEAEEHLRRGRAVDTLLLRHADALVVPSDFLQMVFRKHGLAAERIPNAIDATTFEFRRRAGPYLSFLCTRAMEPSYDVMTVVRAFGRVAGTESRAKLAIVGGGTQRHALEAEAHRLGLSEQQVEFLGEIAPSQMPAVYAKADVFLNASLVDNQPLSILEAMASGALVITTQTGGIADMVRHQENGLLVPARDPDAMARAMLDVLNDSKLFQRLADRARRDIDAHAPAAVTAAWRKLYLRVTRSSEPT